MSGSLFEQSVQQIERLIRARAANSGAVFFTDHARVQMRKRNISIDMALEVMRKGLLKRTPERNLARGSLECRMERFVAGRSLGVIAAISDGEPTLVVVTAMDLGGRR